jgi:hypothetical protein
VRRPVGKTGSHKAAMPLARQAITVFEERQRVLAARDAGQEASRREHRLFPAM